MAHVHARICIILVECKRKTRHTTHFPDIHDMYTSIQNQNEDYISISYLKTHSAANIH